MYLDENIEKINGVLDSIDRDKKVIVWGTGEYALKLVEYTHLLNLNLLCFVNSFSHSEEFCGKKVKVPNEVSWDNVDVAIVASFYQCGEIVDQLRDVIHFKGSIICLEDSDAQTPFYTHRAKYEMMPSIQDQKLLERNRIFKDTHKGERIFILACGPSINEMDLSVLKHEKTMGLNYFYLHKDCYNISCDYYCSPRMSTYFSENQIKEWVQSVSNIFPDTKVFVDLKDREYIKEITDSSFYYIANEMSGNYYEEIDLTQKIMAPTTAPVMAIQLALYMGFSEIYLLGTEYDHYWTGRYKHFYSDGHSKYEAPYNTPFKIAIKQADMVWKQFELLNKLAGNLNAKIYNATMGGAVDVFERVGFNSLFMS